MNNIFLVAETRDYVTRTCVGCRNVYNLQICCVELAQPSGQSVLLAPSFYSVKSSEPFYRTTFMQMDKIEKFFNSQNDDFVMKNWRLYSNIHSKTLN